MLDFTFYYKNESFQSLEITEDNYEKICNAGFGKIISSSEKELTIDGEKYTVDVVELSNNNRKTILDFIETERHKELVKLFSKLDNTPTLKEIRDNFSYIKFLTNVYSNIKENECIYFSY